MKDRPASEGLAPGAPTVASKVTRPVRLVFAHFWKIFAATCLIAGLGVWYASRSVGNYAHEESPTTTRVEESGQPRGQSTHFRLMRDLIDKQSQPAAIVFKTQAPPALGYLASLDDECVVLRSLYKDEAKEQTILIPWDNILYIRLNTKMSAPEPEATAVRDSRSNSPARVRR